MRISYRTWQYSIVQQKLVENPVLTSSCVDKVLLIPCCLLVFDSDTSKLREVFGFTDKDHHIPSPKRHFCESMIFLFPFGGICDRSLEGRHVECCQAKTGIIKWDPFLWGIKVDAKIYGKFSGFPVSL